MLLFLDVGDALVLALYVWVLGPPHLRDFFGDVGLNTFGGVRVTPPRELAQLVAAVEDPRIGGARGLWHSCGLALRATHCVDLVS